MHYGSKNYLKSPKGIRTVGLSLLAELPKLNDSNANYGAAPCSACRCEPSAKLFYVELFKEMDFDF